jgi:hypothetical protein
MARVKAGSNVYVEDKGGMTLFYSYDTIVAAHIPGRGVVKGDKFYSLTTSKQIIVWANGNPIEVLPQGEFEELLGIPAQTFEKVKDGTIALPKPEVKCGKKG